MLARAMVDRGGVNPDKVYPGDIIAGGESVTPGANVVVGASVLTGAQIASGIITRSGSTAGYIDTTDSAVNILNALRGNMYSVETVQDTSFRLLLKNTVAFALTLAAGAGVVLGSGVLNVAASTWREFLVTVKNAQRQNIVQAVTINGSQNVTFAFPTGQTAYAMGSNGQLDFTNGASVSGTGIPAGATVQGILTNGAGIYGVVISAAATADAPAGIAATFGPTILIDGLRSGTL